MAHNTSLIYSGPIIYSISLNELKIIPNGVITVQNGKIVSVEESARNIKEIQRVYNVRDDRVLTAGKSQFLIPGFIDSHIHASQYPNVGLGYDMPLLDWLNRYTYPLEKKYVDVEFARRVYNAVIKKTLATGTTTCSYYTTIHLESSKLFADVAAELGQRVFVGKVNMNKDTPPEYGETTEESLTNTELFIQYILGRNNDLVKPVVTPRFALSCDMDLMKKLAELAKKYDVHIQTHISENKDEVSAVHASFPDCKHYADVYDKANLLTNKTILAHGVYLTDEELVVLRERGSSVSHCPNSNTSLHSGLCNARRLLNSGVYVGLGTDCAGGYSTSMLDSIRQAMHVSVHLSLVEHSTTCSYLGINEAFFLATLGGAQALSIQDVTGNFEVGKSFDAILVDLEGAGNIDLLDEYDLSQLFQKFLYLGDERNVKEVYVAGRLVSGQV